MIVVDTNVVAYLVIDGERTAAARSVRRRDPAWCVPTWWRAEFMNVLARAVRHGVLDRSLAWALWTEATAMMRGFEASPAEEAVLLTAIDGGFTAYDAWFVALADALDVPLVTADRRLVAARPDRAILLEDFAAGSPRGQDAP